jgi:hypothetical protein
MRIASVGIVAILILPACSGVGETRDDPPMACEGQGGCAACPVVECFAPTDCPAAASCHDRTCTDGKCGEQLAPSGSYLLDLVPGDCSRTVCTDNGVPFHQKDFSDLPDPGECMVGTCIDGLGPIAKPTGTPCSTGLCKDGACVAQIPVYCDTFNIVVTGCAPEQTTGQSIMWSSDGKARACMGNTLGQAEYCPPGTPCYGFVNGVASKGVCVEHP